jgi:hypothetical protein
LLLDDELERRSQSCAAQRVSERVTWPTPWASELSSVSIASCPDPPATR